MLLNILENRTCLILETVCHKLNSKDKTELEIFCCGASGDFIACIHEVIKKLQCITFQGVSQDFFVFAEKLKHFCMIFKFCVQNFHSCLFPSVLVLAYIHKTEKRSNFFTLRQTKHCIKQKNLEKIALSLLNKMTNF